MTNSAWWPTLTHAEWLSGYGTKHMPTFQFEAMDATGAEIKDVIEAPTEQEAQATIRQMGYFVTKITVKKERKKKAEKTTGGKKRGFAIGGVSGKLLTQFTRQLSILQDAGLPI